MGMRVAVRVCVCVSVGVSVWAGTAPKINLNNIANLLWNKMSANSSEQQEIQQQKATTNGYGDA